jgi:hypothetical protein
VVVPLERAFVSVVAGAGCFFESYGFGRHCAIAKRLVAFPTRSPRRVVIGRTLGHSRGGCGGFLRRISWALVRHLLCVSRTSVASRVSRLPGM